MIFIVDDDESVRASLTRLLRSAGFPAEAFSAAEDFLGDAPQDDCECVIIDIHMAGMNGLELQQALLRRKTVPCIILMTAYEDLEIRRKGIEAGAAAFLKKPFDDDALLQVVSTAVGHEQDHS